MSDSNPPRRVLLVSVGLIVALLICTFVILGRKIEVDHPYADVEWGTFVQYKANLHTHTTLSDGKVDPAGVIDLYHEHDYKVLALTDHDTKKEPTTTWPWTDFDRDPKELGMIAIEGNELSKLHHIGSLYSDYSGVDIQAEEEAYQAISDLDGLGIINHPGRYYKSTNPDRYRSFEWYLKSLRGNPHILGLEVYNQDDRYPNDRELWDAVLTEILPERKVWGFANDDMHTPSTHFGFSWNVLLLKDLDDGNTREVLEEGEFFFAHSPKGIEGPAAPVINEICVNEWTGKIRIRAKDYESVEWIAEGEVVHKGEEMDLRSISGKKYVRAVVHGNGGTVVCTQPFVL